MADSSPADAADSSKQPRTASPSCDDAISPAAPPPGLGLKLGLMCGLPRSGKSTYARILHAAHGYAIVSPDAIRQVLTGQSFRPESEAMVWAVAQTMARSLLLVGQHVLIDATNITRERRHPWVSIAREFDATVIIYCVRTPFAECLDRNIGIGAVPGDVIARMYTQLEWPSSDEAPFIYEP